MADVGIIVHEYEHFHHSYADDTQLISNCLPHETAILRSRVMSCIVDIYRFMACNRFKSEFIWCATARRQHYVDNGVFHLEDGDVNPSASVRNLGAFYDSSMSINTHVSRLIRTCYYQLRRVRAIRRSIPTPTTVQTHRYTARGLLQQPAGGSFGLPDRSNSRSSISWCD